MQSTCVVVGPSYAITAQHKSSIGCASFTCVVVDLLLCKTKVMLTSTLCLMLGQHLRLWINMNPVLGHRSYWCVVSVSTTHSTNIGLKLVHRLRRRLNIK